MQDWLRKKNVDAHFQNDQAERLNRCLGEQLKIMKHIEKEKRWPEYLSFIQATYDQNWVQCFDCEPKVPSLHGVTATVDSSQLKHLEESARQYRLTEFEGI